MKKSLLTCGFLLLNYLTFAQLLVIPALGVQSGELTTADNSLINITETEYISPVAGIEVAYGFSKAWALGLQYRYGFSNHAFSPREESVEPLMGDVDFGHHQLALRSKYVLLDRFFLNAGVVYHTWTFDGAEVSDGFSLEGETHPFLGPQVGLEFIFKKFVIGADYHWAWGFGNRSSSATEWIASLQFAEVYFGYLFRFKVRSGKVWEKNCPKF